MEGFEPSRRKSLLDHFSAIKDTRQSCKVMYRLEEVLLLVVCGGLALSRTVTGVIRRDIYRVGYGLTLTF